MSGPSPKPPLLGRLLLRLCRLGDRRTDVRADMQELFAARAETLGTREARRRFNADARSVWLRPPSRTPRGPWPRPRWSWVTDIPGDIVYGARVLRKQAGVVSMAVIGLAVAIGLTTAVFSVANAFNFKPLGVADPARVVFPQRTVGQMRTGVHGWAPEHVAVMRASARTVALGSSLESRVVVGEGEGDGDAAAARVSIRFVSDGFLEIFGARTIAGRLPDATDVQAGAPPVAVLNHEFWRSALNSDPAVVGRAISMNGSQVTVVGVLARGFTGPFDVNRTPAAWLPMEAARTVDALAGLYGGTPGTVELVGGLAPGATLAQAEAELLSLAIGAGAVTTTPESRGPTGVLVRVGGNEFTAEDAVILVVLLMIVGLVVVLAGTNVASLMLATVTGRQLEVSTRLALGASRDRVIRQLTTESVAVALVSGAFGLLFAQWFVAIGTSMFVLSPAIDLSLDWRVYTFVVGVSVMAGLASGLTPALQGTRASVGFPKREHRSRSRLVSVQAAASVLLLLLTALFTRALVEVSSRELGFDPTRVAVLTAFSPLKTAMVPDADFFPLAQDRIRALPGVRAVALANHAPYEGSYTPVPTSLHGQTYRLNNIKATPGFFNVVGYRFLQGRPYTEDEVRTGAKVAVVTAGFARDWFPDGDAIGADLGLVRDYLAGMRIVGIVTNAVPHIGSPAASTSETLLTPLMDFGAARIVISTDGDAAATLPVLRDAIGAIDAGRTLNTRVVADGLEEQLNGPRILAMLAGIVGALAVVLAVVGMFGVTAFTVAARRRDIGIRLAIGASKGGVVIEVIRSTLRPAAIGLVAGLGLALIGGQAIALMLYAGVSPRDPLSFAVAAGLMILAASAGIVIPARRAAGVDPVESLRVE